MSEGPMEQWGESAAHVGVGARGIRLDDEVPRTGTLGIPGGRTPPAARVSLPPVSAGQVVSQAGSRSRQWLQPISMPISSLWRTH